MAVLLLNASLQPLNVISHRRLVVLLTKERVAFVDEAAERAAAEALAVRRLPEELSSFACSAPSTSPDACSDRTVATSSFATITPASTAAVSAPRPSSPSTTSSRYRGAARRIAGTTW